MDANNLDDELDVDLNIADQLGIDMNKPYKPKPLVINLGTDLQAINTREFIKHPHQLARRAHNDVVAALNTARKVLYPDANDSPLNGQERSMILKHIRDFRRIANFLESLVEDDTEL